VQGSSTVAEHFPGYSQHSRNKLDLHQRYNPVPQRLYAASMRTLKRAARAHPLMLVRICRVHLEQVSVACTDEKVQRLWISSLLSL
jgi:hypothetical protein